MKEPIKVYSNESIINYCTEHDIRIEDFNKPVIIPEGVTKYINMFKICESFNQKKKTIN